VCVHCACFAPAERRSEEHPRRSAASTGSFALAVGPAANVGIVGGIVGVADRVG